MSRFIVALLLLAACDGGESPTETATVSALREPCVGEGPLLCLNVGVDGQVPSREFSGIEGFTHRWGVESEITFRTEIIENPPADGSSQVRILVDIVEETTTVTAPFQLDFPGSGWFSGAGTSLQMVGTTVQCDAAICDQITTADSGDAPFEVTLELTDDPQTLRATAVSL